jgi:hypothetical protein
VVGGADPEQAQDGQAVQRHRDAGPQAVGPGQRDERTSSGDRAERGEQVQPAAHPGPGVGVVEVGVGVVGDGPAGRLDRLDLLALGEHGLDGLAERCLQLRPVGGDPGASSAVARERHAPRLRSPGEAVIPTGL